MSAEPWPAGVGRILLPTVDSTNAHALRPGAALAPPCWVLALEQTGGRGRRGRPWLSPRGNFHATLAMQPDGPPDRAALRSFVAALALRDALAAVTGLPQALALKWPNDVLLNGAKVAGILLESAGAGRGVALLAVGVGVNLIAAPDAALLEPGAVPPVSLLAETGLRLTPEAFLAHLAPAFARWEALFQARGFAPLRAAWLSHAARLGQPIRARTGTTEHAGVFETIDTTGALILSTPRGRQAIPAAEIFF